MTLQPQEKAIMTTLIGTSRTERSSRTTPTSHNGPTIYISQGKHHTCIYCRQRSGCIWNTAAYEDAFCEQVIHYIYYYIPPKFLFPSIFTYIFKRYFTYFWMAINREKYFNYHPATKTLRQNWSPSKVAMLLNRSHVFLLRILVDAYTASSPSTIGFIVFIVSSESPLIKKNTLVLW